MIKARKAERVALLPTLSEAVVHRLEASSRFRSARVVMAYAALPDEVDTLGFLERWCKQKTLLLPVVTGSDLCLKVYSGQADMKPGAYGIAEPQGECFTAYETIDLAVVPGVAFDANGNRLGRGKGYYDRFFHSEALRGVYKIGLCFDFQKVPQLPSSPWDVPMDEVI